ncbi:MAG: hypothetical protein K0R50_823, partial [Eubacterium sp.]|nr:hypothetical protein [Eubacterium sp.]
FRVMKKRYYSKTYLLDESYKKYLLEILDSEDRQNIYLKNFLSVI